jgi:cell division GTPase FtsZ
MSYQAAIDAFGKMTRVLKAFEDVDIVLAALVGAEQNKKELFAAIESAKAELELVNIDINKAKAELVKVKSDMKKTTDAAQSKAEQIISKAHEEADVMKELTESRVLVAKDTAEKYAAAVDESIRQKTQAEKELQIVTDTLNEARKRMADFMKG